MSDKKTLDEMPAVEANEMPYSVRCAGCRKEYLVLVQEAFFGPEHKWLSQAKEAGPFSFRLTEGGQLFGRLPTMPIKCPSCGALDRLALGVISMGLFQSPAARVSPLLLAGKNEPGAC